MCAAKGAGATVPHRKCTCASEVTEHRNRQTAPPKRFEGICNVVRDKEGRYIPDPTARHAEIAFPSHLVDRLNFSGLNTNEWRAKVDPEGRFPVEAAFIEFERKLRWGMPGGKQIEKQLEATKAIIFDKFGRHLRDFEADLALSLASLYRSALESACSEGNVDLVEFWRAHAGLDVTSHCEAFLDPTGAAVPRGRIAISLLEDALLLAHRCRGSSFVGRCCLRARCACETPCRKGCGCQLGCV